MRSLEKTAVLLVEDELLILQDLLSLYDWQGEGYWVETASNGLQGLDKFIALRPGIVITDVRMPHMDGLTMIARIRQVAPETKFIILSAYGDFDYAREAMKLGVTEYLLKKDLSAETVDRALRAATRAAPRSEPVLPAGADRDKLSPIVERAAAYIREHYQEPGLRIGGIALACSISPGRLSTRFREEMNTTVNEYVTFIRLENAKRLLLSGKYKVYEVADMVGYRDQAYFSTLFQERTGLKPNKYHE